MPNENEMQQSLEYTLKIADRILLSAREPLDAVLASVARVERSESRDLSYHSSNSVRSVSDRVRACPGCRLRSILATIPLPRSHRLLKASGEAHLRRFKCASLYLVR